MALLSDDYGRDLASVQALQRKHEGLERDLAALESKVGLLGDDARKLQGRHPESADQIAAKQAEIVGLWEGIKRKASNRGGRLDGALQFQKFLGDNRYRNIKYIPIAQLLYNTIKISNVMDLYVHGPK